MRAKLVAIGTSKGIRLPKYLLEKYHLEDEIEMIETRRGIVLVSAKIPRQGWKEAFKKIAGSKHDRLIEMPESDWDKEEWEWK